MIPLLQRAWEAIAAHQTDPGEVRRVFGQGETTFPAK
jgi:hypothetical protein